MGRGLAAFQLLEFVLAVVFGVLVSPAGWVETEAPALHVIAPSITVFSVWWAGWSVAARAATLVAMFPLLPVGLLVGFARWPARAPRTAWFLLGLASVAAAAVQIWGLAYVYRWWGVGECWGSC